MLVRNIRAGDRAAEFELDRRWRPRLVGCARTVLSDDSLAEDAAQLALWRMFLNLEQYNESRPLGPWLFTIVSNCARDLRRRQNADRAVGGTALLHRVAVSGSEDEDLVVREEELAALRACIEDLDDRSRLVLVLHMTGFSLSAISRLLHHPKSTVQDWLNKALVRLRDHMAAKGFAQAR
jgi:RNA polymerase sigma-70 factor (ECF subfamily)